MAFLFSFCNCFAMGEMIMDLLHPKSNKVSCEQGFQCKAPALLLPEATSRSDPPPQKWIAWRAKSTCRG